MTVTNKQFRAILNAAFPFDPAAPGNGNRGENGCSWKATKRSYGDYLWFQDRDMFMSDKAEYEAGRLPHLNKAAA